MGAALAFTQGFLTVTDPAVTVALSPSVLARSAIEGATRSAWLFQSGIGARERVARRMNERLEDLREQFRYQEALPDEVRRARARFNAIKKVARGHGYPVKEGIGDRRQTPAAILGKLLGDKDKGFSKVLLGSLSAVTHASGSGVMQFAMSTDHPQRSTLEL